MQRITIKLAREKKLWQTINLKHIRNKILCELYQNHNWKVPHDEIAAYYTAADLFVCASSSETQGLTYLEAQAAGLPIICRRDDCLNDVVINGENGWQYENYDEFYEHLACMLENDRIQIMGQNAYQHMTTHYSAAAFASKILEIYREVLDGYTPSGSEIE